MNCRKACWMTINTEIDDLSKTSRFSTYSQRERGAEIVKHHVTINRRRVCWRRARTLPWMTLRHQPPVHSRSAATEQCRLSAYICAPLGYSAKTGCNGQSSLWRTQPARERSRRMLQPGASKRPQSRPPPRVVRALSRSNSLSNRIGEPYQPPVICTGQRVAVKSLRILYQTTVCGALPRRNVCRPQLVSAAFRKDRTLLRSNQHSVRADGMPT